jgi:CheY-like chemotaxis protein
LAKDGLPSGLVPTLILATMTAPDSGKTGASHKKAPLIYVVDDEPMLLELAVVILEPHGYSLKTFRDPDLALQTFIAADPKPDLLITDYAMHSMNGMQMIEQFKRVNPAQRIILVSGTVGEYIFEKSPCKPDRFLAKPYQASQLASAVKELLAK